MKCDDGESTKSLTEVAPHDYVPSALHMGDCAICGHVADAPLHRFAENREIARLMCMVREQAGEIAALQARLKDRVDAADAWARLTERMRKQAEEIDRGAAGVREQAEKINRLTWLVEELVPFLAVWAAQYQRENNLDGLHPAHYDLLRDAGARMEDFVRASEKGGMRSER